MWNPIKLIIGAIRIILLVLPMAIFLLIYLFLTKLFFKDTVDRAFKLRRLYVKYACFIMGIIVKKEGDAKTKPAVYVCNHRSLSDPIVTSIFLDAFIIAKAEVESIPLLATGAKVTGILFVKRENKDSRSAVREKMKETLLSGQNILVYPEGTVNAAKEPLEYRPGTFITACNENIPVVPIVLEYKHQKDLWENRKMIPHFFHQFGWPLTFCKTAFGPPMTAEDPMELKAKVEQWSMDKINEIHNDWNSVFT